MSAGAGAAFLQLPSFLWEFFISDSEVLLSSSLVPFIRAEVGGEGERDREKERGRGKKRESVCKKGTCVILFLKIYKPQSLAAFLQSLRSALCLGPDGAE